jgi:hypothetical protein
MPHRGFFLLAAALLLALSACSDNSTAPPGETTGTVAGLVTRIDNDQPLPGTTVVLTTDEFVVLRAAKVDQHGAFSFGDVPAGSLLLYAINEDFKMAEPSASRINLRGGQTWTAKLLMMEYGDPNLHYRIKGRVTDATTGVPLDGVWIANTGLGEAGNSVRYLMNNSGITIAVSDEEGLYSLPMYGVEEFWGGPVIGLGPISCGREGYRSRTFAGEGPDFSHELPGGLLPAPADSVLVLDIALEPIPADGLPSGATGTVRGIVVHDGRPQGGVMVTMTLMALAERDTVFDPAAKVAFHGGSVRSGEDGSFEFKVEPGFYGLRAGLPPDDGWCRDTGLSNLEVVAGEVADVGDITVGAAIAPLSPAPGTKVTSQSLKLSWTPITGAETYEVTASINSFSSSGFFVGTTTEPELLWQLTMPSPGETNFVRWRVFATRTVEGRSRVRFSWFEVPATFTIANESSP